MLPAMIARAAAVRKSAVVLGSRMTSLQDRGVESLRFTPYFRGPLTRNWVLRLERRGRHTFDLTVNVDIFQSERF